MAREFTKNLINFDIDFTKENISSQIKNHKDFIPYWENDPSVKSMLIVLDLIHKKAKNKNIKFEDLNKITFEIFQLDDFTQKQSEELYSKMNSRGKPLSAFETFKAKIIQIVLEKKDKKLYEKVAKGFEKDWINQFWNISCDDATKVDERFINFIYFITEMRYYDLNKDIEKLNVKSFTFLREFYSNDENLNFLIHMLDRLGDFIKYSKNFENFEFFTRNINLFEEIIENYNKMTITHKILAYMLLKSLDENSEYLLRIIRNDLNRRDRTLKTGKIEYTLTIENKDIPRYLKDYNNLLDGNPYKKLTNLNYRNESMNQEKLKANLILENENIKEKIFKLENFKYLKGDLGLILQNYEGFNSLSEKIEFLADKFIKLFEKDDSFIARSLLSFGYYYYDYYIGCYLWIGNILRGDKYYFGQKNKWEIIFTTNTQTKKNLEIYNSFFLHLDNLENNIEEKINTYDNENKDWIYYFLKYPEILNKSQLSNIIGWLYAWDNDNCNIEKLETFTRITNYRLNVFLIPIAKVLDKNILRYKIIYEDDNSTFLEKGDIQIYVENNTKCKICIYNLKSEKLKQFALFDKIDAIEKTIKYLKNIKLI